MRQSAPHAAPLSSSKEDIMRKPLVAGNWKMFKTRDEAAALVEGIKGGLGPIDTSKADILICPPYPWLPLAAEWISGSPIMLGAQNLHEEAQGAFTGEVSAGMLASVPCGWVLVGHSERRHVFGEPASRLAAKVKAGLEAGLQVIYCIGETIEEREAERTQAVLDQQLSEVLEASMTADRLTIAYEPVWAIGTGKTATPELAQAAHAFVRGKLAEILGAETAQAMRILYGGSVKPGNAAGLLAQEDIDGALVGGACLVAEDFLAIISAGAAS
jgi:triosephosphate isomerase